MTISASFTFSGVATSLAKKSVAAATSFTATIDDLSGVQSVTWSIIGTDGTTDPGDYTLTPSGSKGSIVTITSLAAGTGAMLQAVVASGGVTDTKRALFYVPSATIGLEPFVYNELAESDSAYAYVTKLNAVGAAVDAFTVGSVPDPLTVDTINLGSTIDASGNDINVTASNWITSTVADGGGIEDHADTAFIADVATGYVSIAAGASAATGLADGEVRLAAAGLCGIYSEDAFEIIGATTVSLQGAGTYALHIGDGFGDGDLAATAAIDATAMTLCAVATSLAVGNGSCATTHSASSWALTTTSGATLNSIPIRLPYAVRVLSTANIANLTTVTVVDSVTLADDDLVGLVAQSTTTQNGLYRFTLSTTTLARATAFDNLAEYHLGTTMRAYAGAANKGKAYQLTALSSSLPATWEDITGSGGGGSSITDGTGTLGIASSGDMTTTGLDSVSIASHSSVIGIDASGFVEIDGANAVGVFAGTSLALSAATTAAIDADGGNVALNLNSSGSTTAVDATDYDRTTWAGGSAEHKVAISGTSVARTVTGTAGTLGLTETVNATAASSAYVGDFTCTAPNTTITSTTTTTLNCTYLSMTASGGSASLTCSLVGRFAGYGGLELNSNTGQVGMGHPALEDELIHVMPTSVTPGGAGATAIGAITVPASSSGDFTGTVSVRNGSTNSKVFSLVFSWNADGTTVTVRDRTTADVGTTQGTIGTVFGDIDNTASGLVVTIRAANASGFRCAVRGLARVNL